MSFVFPTRQRFRSLTALSVVILALVGPAAFTMPCPALQETPDETESPEDVATEKLSVGEREPFDRLHFGENDANAILDVQPIEFPGGKVPDPFPKGEWLRFRLIDRPQYLFEAPWASITKIDRYQDMLLEEARGFIAQQAFDKAYPSLARLLRDYPQTRGLARMRSEFLYANAEQLLSLGKTDEALTVLDELDRIDRSFKPRSEAPTVGELLSQVLDRIVGDDVRAGEFDRAERYMTLMLSKYGDTQNTVIQRWRGEIRSVALGFMTEAQSKLDAGDGRGAHQSVRKMFGILRDLEGGRELAEEVLQRFPLVIVGVPQTAAMPDPISLDSWASRRLGRLSYRTLLEHRGQGQDGGVYELVSGKIALSEDRKTLRFQLDESAPDPLNPPVDLYAMSRRLFDLANPENPESIPAWSRLMSRLEIEDPRNLRIDLRFPHVLPESLVGLPLVPVGETIPEPNGVYAPVEGMVDAEERRFLVRDSIRASVQRNWPDIVERRFATHDQAVAAIERADIDVLEQVFPGDVARLRSNPDLVVERYQLPTVHLLIPNRRVAAMRFPVFRRALMYGADRQLILRQMLLAGAPLEGAQLISGPFPAGVNESDPLNYAYDFRLDPLPYDKRLGQALVELSRIQLEDELERERIERGEAAPASPMEKPPIQLVLAYPEGDVARIACEAMVKQWLQIGVVVKLRPLPPGVTRPSDEDWDLLYAEIVMAEPLTDARRLLSETGLARVNYAPVDLTLRRLDAAETWSRARRALYELHLLTYNDVTILPLWQLPMYHARRKGLEGVGGDLRTLYDDVGAWTLSVGAERRP